MKKNNKFEQLNIDLSDLVTTTIKLPKLQEISTISLLNCFLDKRKKLKYVKMIVKRNYSNFN